MFDGLSRIFRQTIPKRLYSRRPTCPPQHGPCLIRTTGSALTALNNIEKIGIGHIIVSHTITCEGGVDKDSGN
jgi:hypothetical protein